MDDKAIKDPPMNLDFITKMTPPSEIEKLPHQRFLLSDEMALQITVKLMLLHINYSGNHHNHDRPKLQKSLKHLLQNFFCFKPFDELAAQCAEKQRLECLQASQIDLIMN